MAEPLQIYPIMNLGSFGITTKDSYAITDDPRWAIEANNCFTDNYGRLCAREGYTKTTTTALVGANKLYSMGEYIKQAGTTEIISGANNNLYKGTTTLTSIYSTSISADNWHFSNFNDLFYAVQSGHHPLVYNGTTCQKLIDTLEDWTVGRTTSLGDVVIPTTNNNLYYEATGVTGSQPYTTHAATEPTWPTTVGDTVVDNEITWTTREIPQADIILSAFGRVWMARSATNKTTVWFSDTLLGNKFGGGLSGTLDMYEAWEGSTDEVTALAAFNGRLVVFGKNSVTLWTGANDPSTMYVEEVIKGTGCIARDSIQYIGEDLLYMSHFGVKSLQRAIQAGSLPMDEKTKNVYNIYHSYVSNETSSLIKTTYSEKSGFYLITLPTFQLVLCLNIRTPLEDGTYPAFTWTRMNPHSFCNTQEGVLYLGKEGFIATFGGYLDNTSNYTSTYESTWLAFDTQGEPRRIKIPKKLTYHIFGGNNTGINWNWSFDYSANIYNQNDLLTTSYSEYNTSSAEYNIDEWSSGIFLNSNIVQLRGTGEIMKFGFIAPVDGTPISINKVNIFLKQGKVL